MILKASACGFQNYDYEWIINNDRTLHHKIKHLTRNTYKQTCQRACTIRHSVDISNPYRYRFLESYCHFHYLFHLTVSSSPQSRLNYCSLKENCEKETTLGSNNFLSAVKTVSTSFEGQSFLCRLTEYYLSKKWHKHCQSLSKNDIYKH